MRPFVLRERSDECQPSVQPMYSEDATSQFYFEALEVYQTVKNLTPEQQEIARYWSDDAARPARRPAIASPFSTKLVRDQDCRLTPPPKPMPGSASLWRIRSSRAGRPNSPPTSPAHHLHQQVIDPSLDFADHDATLS